MQEQNVYPMRIAGTDAPFLWGASWDQKARQPEPMAAFMSQTRELEELERAQQVQAQSMMVLVHELRSPAAASKSMAATLRYIRPDDAQLNDFMNRIENRMDQMLDLVDDILDLSQAKAGRPLGQATLLDLVEETATVCQPYQEDAAAKGLTMEVELPESAVRVRMPEQAYHLIVSNLVSNAVKYTPDGSVGVTLRREGAHAVLALQDTGIGIPPDEVCHLFTEFFRTSSARAGSAPGTGLGLATVKALVENWGGDLALQSQVNQGSSFTVRLPLCGADTLQEGASPRRVESKRSACRASVCP